MVEAPFGQIAAHQGFELGQGQAGKISGQLLGADLKQKGRHGAGSSTRTTRGGSQGVKAMRSLARSGKGSAGFQDRAAKTVTDRTVGPRVWRQPIEGPSSPQALEAMDPQPSPSTGLV